VLVMVATGTITLAFLAYVFPGTVGSWSIQVQGLLIVGFILLSALLAILQFQASRLAHPTVFWACSVIGALASLIGIVSTLSGSWTPLVSNDAGTVSVFGAKIAYGAWFWWVAGIALASMVVGALLYPLGRRTEASAAQPGPLPAVRSGG
jgi:hypothetical protein